MGGEKQPPLPTDDEEARFDDEGSAVGHPEPAETEPANVGDQHRQALLDSSANYVEAKMAFEKVILAAQRAGMTDEAIARVTGLSVPMIRAVLRTT
jgi:hypothetical protein